MPTEYLKTERRSESNPLVFFDIGIDGRPGGRLIIELFKDVTPKTAENFRQLCTGEAGEGKSTGLPLHFKKCPFHRIIKGFMAQGGDFSNKDGTGGESIYGEKFEDENFELLHDRKGMLSMANAGADTNGSQFFITFVATKHLNGKHVVFGQVLVGLGFLRDMELCETGENDKPVKDIIITDCGELEPTSDLSQLTPKIEGTDLPAYPQDFDIPEGSSEMKLKLDACEKIKDLGNGFFKEGNLESALSRYEQALRYADIDIYTMEETREPEDDKRVRLLSASCHSNSAACLLKLERPSDAIPHCSSAIRSLSIDFEETVHEENKPLYVKTLFRRGQAYLAMKKLDEAMEDFQKARKTSPDDKSILGGIAKVKKLDQARREKEKKAYAKMFA
ncbi:hypothetical protein BSKO_10949 [Bryopsis sp. KO-2023]|nr:hypothetical protein BSKO_10949 [Bryopsis sp. KO-2023]